MAACELKLVSAGVKAFEKHPVKGSSIEYRLAQDGIKVLAPYITKRKVDVTAQDISNLLEGGLVSLSTLSEAVKAAVEAMDTGSLVVQYTFKPTDVIESEIDVGKGTGGDSSILPGVPSAAQIERVSNRPYYLVCFKGSTRALNVMCTKNEMESVKHQLKSLGVLRPKIKAEGAFKPPSKDNEGELGEGEKDSKASHDMEDSVDMKKEADKSSS